MKFIEFKESKYKGYSLIEGFPSPDLIATITTKYLIDELKMEKIGYVESKDFFPVVRINNGLPEHPIRIYVSKKYKIVAILPDQIIPTNLIYDYCKALTDWAKKKKIKEIITISAISNPSKDIKIFGIANKKEAIDFLNKYNINIVKEGLTSGLSAQLLMTEKTLPIYLLLGSIGTKTSYEVAAKILEKLNTMYNLNINTKPLIKQSEKLIKEIKLRLQEMQTQKEQNDISKQIMYS